MENYKKDEHQNNIIDWEFVGYGETTDDEERIVDRIAVFGGWLVTVRSKAIGIGEDKTESVELDYLWNTQVTFVPDFDHKWIRDADYTPKTPKDDSAEN